MLQEPEVEGVSTENALLQDYNEDLIYTSYFFKADVIQTFYQLLMGSCSSDMMNLLPLAVGHPPIFTDFRGSQNHIAKISSTSVEVLLVFFFTLSDSLFSIDASHYCNRSIKFLLESMTPQYYTGDITYVFLLL